MLKSRDCFKDMKEKRTYSYPLKCYNHLSEDLNIKIFWVGGMPLCPPRMVCLRRTSTRVLSESWTFPKYTNCLWFSQIEFIF